MEPWPTGFLQLERRLLGENRSRRQRIFQDQRASALRADKNVELVDGPQHHVSYELAVDWKSIELHLLLRRMKFRLSPCFSFTRCNRWFALQLVPKRFR